MIVGTAGHIDHGKSALVEALTGVHPDRLPEEQRRGITLDLGFGHWLKDGEPIGMVDVPGHERFVRTMVAGAAGIDVMLLVVAADAGVQPQTVEHFEICTLLGVRHAVVALSKRDLVDTEQAGRVRAQIRALMEGSAFEDSPLVEVSARTGAGIESLRRALIATGRLAPGRDSSGPFRLPLDRVFTLQGWGTIVTGTLVQGRLRAGAEAELAPRAQPVRVRGLQVHGRAVEEAVAGQRVAVNLAGIEAASLRRGMELLEPGVFALTSVLDVRLDWIAHARAAPHRARMRLHTHTAETLATLFWLQAPAWAQLRLAEPVVAVPGDPFILRQLSPAATVAGGRVLDPVPPLHSRAGYAAAAGHARQLDRVEDLEQRVCACLERAGTTGMALAALARACGRRHAEVRALLENLAARGQCVWNPHPPAALATTALEPITCDLRDALAAFHHREPLAEGAALEALGLSQPAYWLAAAAARLQAAGTFAAAPGARFRLAGAAPARNPEQVRLRQILEEHFRTLGWSAPPLRDLMAAFPQPAARALVADLARAGALVECQPGWYLHASALARLRTLLAEHKRQRTTFSVGEFKDWTGLSRKLAIPLLEYCDRARLTRRGGEVRSIL